jgi:predicted secreted hydrolase
VSLDLYVQPVKPPALQGNQGLSQKSAGVGNASYYYSLSRMASTGTITIKGQPFAVKGSSWLDREWSTSGLSGQQSGWDWFSLQLADGRELMLYQLRLKQGGMDPYSAGSLIDRQGQVMPLQYSDFQITPQGQWKSPTTGTVYPSGWAVAIPSQGLNLTVKPYQPNQELPLTFAYWEGAVQVTGSATGQGYVELTGYGEKQDRGVHR